MVPGSTSGMDPGPHGGGGGPRDGLTAGPGTPIVAPPRPGGDARAPPAPSVAAAARPPAPIAPTGAAGWVGLGRCYCCWMPPAGVAEGCHNATSPPPHAIGSPGPGWIGWMDGWGASCRIHGWLWLVGRRGRYPGGIGSHHLPPVQRCSVQPGYVHPANGIRIPAFGILFGEPSGGGGEAARPPPILSPNSPGQCQPTATLPTIPSPVNRHHGPPAAERRYSNGSSTRGPAG